MDHKQRFEDWMARYWIEERGLDPVTFEAVMEAGHSVTRFYLFSIVPKDRETIDLNALDYVSWSRGNAGGLAYLPGELLPSEFWEVDSLGRKYSAPKRLASKIYGAQEQITWPDGPHRKETYIRIVRREGRFLQALREAVASVLGGVAHLRGILSEKRTSRWAEDVKIIASALTRSVSFAQGRIYQAIRDMDTRSTPTKTIPNLSEFAMEALKESSLEKSAKRFEELLDKQKEERGCPVFQSRNYIKEFLKCFATEQVYNEKLAKSLIGANIIFHPSVLERSPNQS